ncbi:MAG: CRTAC1 family protein [Ardenticatenales bacterium]|nr:CRTAC1 family protein [Ardenticatenales bacterium]
MIRFPRWLAAALVATAALAPAACGGAPGGAVSTPNGDAPLGSTPIPAAGDGTGAGSADGTAASDAPTAARFTAVQAASGLHFRHVNGGSGRKYMVETMGAGGGLLDVDNDGDLDAYLVQSGPLPGFADETPLPNRLYLNDGSGRFGDATATSGAGDTGYGMGTCFGDVQNDGWVDIYVANFGPDALLMNNGDGTFTDGTAAAGVANAAWASSCAMADYDRDGWLDIFVVNYVDHSLANHKRCGPAETPMYCHPDVYNGVRDVLYHNNGDGTFEDVAVSAGVADDDPSQGKGLGVMWLDHDDDGWMDVFVANDSTRQFLYHNNGDGTFAEVGVQRGVAFDAEGKTEAGMGIAVGDIDHDARLDVFLTTLDVESSTLYHNGAGGWFEDLTDVYGLGVDPQSRVGFGTTFLDAENDGDLDLFITNGHIIDNIQLTSPRLTYEQTDQLFLNGGDGHFTDVSAQAGDPFGVPGVGRAAVAGDLDGDADLDLLVTHNNLDAVVLRNDASPRGHAILLDLRSRFGGRPAIGARATVRAGTRVWVAELAAGGSYQGQGSSMLHVGLGDAAAVDEIVIRWPEGSSQTVAGADVRIDAVTRIEQAGAR